MNIPARLCPVNGYDQSGLEQWLERMAAKGWRFGGTAGPLVFFDRCAPAQVRVRLEPTRVHTNEADEELNELYRQAGWNYADCFRNRFYVYYTEDPQAVEPHTDPVIQSYAAGRFFRRALLWLLPLAAVNWLVLLYAYRLLRGSGGFGYVYLLNSLASYFPLYLTAVCFWPICISALLCLGLLLWDLSRLRGVWLVYRRYHALKQGRPLRCTRRRGGGLAVAGALLFLLALPCIWLRGHTAHTYLMEDIEAGTPWVSLGKLETDRYRGGGDYFLFGKDFFWSSGNPLVPVRYTSEQWGDYRNPCPVTTLHIDEEYYRDVTPRDNCQCRLSVEYLRCLTPGLARAVFQDLDHWHDYAEGVPTEHPGLDQLIVYQEEHPYYPGEYSCSLYALRGDTILLVDYRGHQPITEHLDEFAALLEPGAIELTVQPYW